MKISAMIEDLDAAQWAEVQNLQAEYEFADGMTHVCATFLAAPLSLGLERHVEMPLMVFTKATARLAHLGHTVPPWHDMRTPAEAAGEPDVPKVISAIWDRSEPRDILLAELGQ